MKKFEYKEPEFKVVITSVDILTASGEETPAGAIGTVGGGWDTGVGGPGAGGIGFNA